MVLLHNEQLQTMIPTFIHTVVLYATYSPVSVPHTSLRRRLCQPQISIKSSTQSCRKHRTASWPCSYYQLTAEQRTIPWCLACQAPTLINFTPLGWGGKQLSANCIIFNTAVQQHGTEICRKLNKHSCLLRYLFNIQCSPGLHSLEPAITVHFHFKQYKSHVRISEEI